MIERFKDARVGDRVWSDIWGWGKITGVKEINSTEYPILVEFNVNDSTQSYTYTLSGRDYIHHIHPSLFWDEIAIIPPPQPKRMVKKVIEGWVNMYSHSRGKLIWDTEEEAIENQSVGYVTTVKMVGEYEVEEQAT